MIGRAFTFGAATVSLIGMFVSPPPGSGAIGGQVLYAGSATSASDVVVSLTGRGVPPQRVVVDPRGRFVFADLPAGPFAISASKPGYVGGAAGSTYATHPGWPIDLVDGQHVTDLTLKLWKLGVVAGTVTGDAGEALAGLEVDALRRTLMGGHWVLVPGAVGVTDDRGRYRISGLMPGDYSIVARPAPDPETPLLLTLVSANPETGLDILAGAMTTARRGPALDASVNNYPLTFVTDAAPAGHPALLAVDWDRERTSVDIHLKQMHVVRVAGTVSGANGPTEGVTVRLLPVDAEGGYSPVDAASAVCESDGRFEFSAVTAGRYIVSVLEVPSQAPAAASTSPLPAGPTWWANVPLTVGATNVSGISVPLRKGPVVSGRVEFHGSVAPPPADQIAQMAIRLERVDHAIPGASGTWRGAIDPDGHFHTIGVPPGNYLVRVTTPPRGWTLQSAASGGTDALDVPLTIGPADVGDVVVSLTDRSASTMSGNVRDEQGAPVANAAVIAFPADRRLWTDTGSPARRLKLAYPNKAGAYSIAGLPPGDYLVIAVSGGLSGDWQDSKRLDRLAAAAVRVRIEQGENHALDLKAGKP